MLKKLGYLAVITLLSISVLAGCQEQQAAEEGKELGVGTVVGNDPVVKISEETDMMNLTPVEQDLYHAFKKKYDDQVLKEADPITITKLYLHASQTKDFVTEYELYIDDPEQVAWSKEEHLKQAKKRDEAAEQKLFEHFKQIKVAKFYEVDANSGYIEVPLQGEEVGSFQLRKNKAGIWKVNFTPMQ